LGLSLGIIGTPETYIMDAQGVIRFHHLGAVTMALFENQMLPILEHIKVE
jgi:cytochrome c biogenesis protein CcmG/thiol:disulfide interchange protein DsbE